MGEPADVEIRPVGFRDGTDAELVALHTIEAPIEVERGSHRMPQPLESYIAYARNLPLQFDDHAWLASSPDGEPVAVGYCWSNAAGDERVMECDVLVRRDRRRAGVGLRLMALICEATRNDDRSLLTWSTFDEVPAAGAFSRRLGGRAGRVSRTSELILSSVAWTMVESWASAGRARGLGYSVELVDGRFPTHLRSDAVALHRIMKTAPRDDLDIGDLVVDEAFVAQLDRALGESGRTRWTVLVRDPDGSCVGGTEITFEPDDPGTALQQNTGIDPAHRGLGLAKWAKATMLERVRVERPDVQRVRTANAFSNAPMLAINEALGFRVTSARTDWQAEVGTVCRALG